MWVHFISAEKTGTRVEFYSNSSKLARSTRALLIFQVGPIHIYIIKKSKTMFTKRSSFSTAERK